MRLTDILLEPVSNLMVLFAEGSKLDAGARISEAKALLLSTRRLPAICFGSGQVTGTLVDSLRGSVGFDSAAAGGPYRRGCRPTVPFSELALPA